MVDISSVKLELTQSAYMGLAEEFFIKQKMTLYKSYEAIERLSQKKGISSRYSNFDSFKNAWYKQAKENREISKNRKKI